VSDFWGVVISGPNNEYYTVVPSWGPPVELTGVSIKGTDIGVGSEVDIITCGQAPAQEYAFIERSYKIGSAFSLPDGGKEMASQVAPGGVALSYILNRANKKDIRFRPATVTSVVSSTTLAVTDRWNKISMQIPIVPPLTGSDFDVDNTVLVRTNPRPEVLGWWYPHENTFIIGVGFPMASYPEVPIIEVINIRDLNMTWEKNRLEVDKPILWSYSRISFFIWLTLEIVYIGDLVSYTGRKLASFNHDMAPGKTFFCPSFFPLAYSFLKRHFNLICEEEDKPDGFGGFYPASLPFPPGTYPFFVFQESRLSFAQIKKYLVMWDSMGFYSIGFAGATESPF